MTGFPAKVRNLIYERAGVHEDFVRCEYCGMWSRSVQAHHRRPRGIGGSSREDTNTASNGVAVCGLDHIRIETRRADSLATGWLVRQTDSPSKIPILMNGQWWLLDDEGGKTLVEEAA